MYLRCHGLRQPASRRIVHRETTSPKQPRPFGSRFRERLPSNNSNAKLTIQQMQPKPNFLVLSALGDDHPGIIDKLTKAILDAECNIQDTRMTVLGGKFAILMQVDGPWDRLARLQDQIPELQNALGLTIITERTEPVDSSAALLPYGVDVVALDQPGIVHNLASFFADRNINIEDMVTSSYAAAHTGTPMFAVRITLGIPADVHIAGLREEFMDFCDGMNIDAVLEPVKG